MLRVGLTGGIGSGKSAVSERLAALGAVVIDADKAARAVVEPGTPGLARIAEAFGPGLLGEDGSLDRAKLAAIVFSDDAARARLNSIVHPLVHERMRAAEEAAVRAGNPGAVIVHDVPLLAEGARAKDFDLVVVVDVPPEVQVERLAGQRGMPAGQARARMAAQATREQRLAVADLVIDNSGTLADLDRRVAAVWSDLQERAQGACASRQPPPPAPLRQVRNWPQSAGPRACSALRSLPKSAALSDVPQYSCCLQYAAGVIAAVDAGTRSSRASPAGSRLPGRPRRSRGRQHGHDRRPVPGVVRRRGPHRRDTTSSE